MFALPPNLLAALTAPLPVADSATTTSLLLGASVVGIGLFARFVKNRQK